MTKRTLTVLIISLLICAAPCAVFAGTQAGTQAKTQAGMQAGTQTVGTFTEGSKTYEKIVVTDESIQEDTATSGINLEPVKRSKKTTYKQFKVKGKKYKAALTRTTPGYGVEEESSGSDDAEKHTRTTIYKKNSKHKVHFTAAPVKIRGYHLANVHKSSKSSWKSDSAKKPCSVDLTKTEKTNRTKLTPVISVQVNKKSVVISYKITSENKITKKVMKNGKKTTTHETTVKTTTVKCTYK